MAIRTVGGGRRRTRVTYFQGIALVPSVITTRAGRFRLLAVPMFDVKPGKMGDALKDLRANFSKVSAAAKAAGLIADYRCT